MRSTRVTLPAGVDAVHLGNLRGRDAYKHHDVAVIAGRLEPGVGAIEDMARAMFGDEAEPIALVSAGAHGGTRYPTEQRRYRMAGISPGSSRTTLPVRPLPCPCTRTRERKRCWSRSASGSWNRRWPGCGSCTGASGRRPSTC